MFYEEHIYLLSNGVYTDILCGDFLCAAHNDDLNGRSQGVFYM
jgi:hypothetical protein